VEVLMKPLQLLEKMELYQISPVKGRSGPNEFLVSHALGDTYYFLHADSLPVPTFTPILKRR
jgi:hypothetical protein